MNRPIDRLRQDAVAIYDAAVAGVEPKRVLTRALAMTPPPDRIHLLAVGKAAHPMASAAVQHLDRLEVPIAGGVVITPDAGRAPDGRLIRVAGDHPLPADGSRTAATAVGEALTRVEAKDEVWLLLSGGATSLLGAPVEGLSDLEYRRLIGALGNAGLPIGDLNRVRKRFSRWGAGRLAAASRGRRLRVYALSDVPGDHPADIGSGPAEPDRTTASEIRAILETLPNRADIPEVVFRWLDRVDRGDIPETPKPGDAHFESMTARVIGSNALARDAAAVRARALGYDVREADDLVTGDAAAAGRRIAAMAAEAPPGIAWILGGETTVALGSRPGKGGRCQELALAAAEALDTPSRAAVVLLAGGTDGRDGPTDAAGAVVDGTSWRAIIEAGGDPGRSLATHDAYSGLASIGALLRPGLTGTNVMDVMVLLT